MFSLILPWKGPLIRVWFWCWPRRKPNSPGNVADLVPNTSFPEWGPQRSCSVQPSEMIRPPPFNRGVQTILSSPSAHSGCQIPRPSPRDPYSSHCHLQTLGRSLLVLSPTIGAVRGLERLPSAPWQPRSSEPVRVGGSSPVLLSPFP